MRRLEDVEWFAFFCTHNDKAMDFPHVGHTGHT